MSANPYGDPTAMRNAIADRLRPLARERGVELSSLQRQFAYDRLLSRVFRSEPDRWVLKGATAMLASLTLAHPLKVSRMWGFLCLGPLIRGVTRTR